MTKKEKLVEKFKNTPESVRYSELGIILAEIGFEEITTKGSHTKWKHPALIRDLVFPIHNNDCKGFYKSQALKIIQQNNLLNN
jgi:predicted RNA binding protein YcfA (HicA-like mRNA interferase family)